MYEEKVKALYSRLGLNFNPLCRISQYFTYLRDIEIARNSSRETFSRIVEKNKAKYYFSLFYVLEICSIIDALETFEQDEKIVKEKLIDLAKGTYLLSEESSNNTKARNTAFELSLFSFLKSKGLGIKLRDPNPDLILVSKKFTYNIECKRPNSVRSLEKNIKDAFKQLKKTTKGNTVPTIALSLEQIIFDLEQNKLDGDEKFDFILDSTDGNSALSFLNRTLYNFLEENNRLLGKICKDEPCLILYSLSCLVGLKTDGIMATATFVTGNVFNFRSTLSSSIVEDLYNMIPQ